MEPTHLVTLSGGVDSTFCLWRTLEAGHRCMVLHVNMHKRRSPYEMRAVRGVLDWLRRNKLHNFQYYQAQLDYSSWPRLVDIEAIAQFQGAALLRIPSLTHVVIGANAEDIQQGEKYEERARRRCELVSFLAGREPEWVYPAIEHTKRELIEIMPPTLVRHCWSCWNPSDRGEKCGRCQPCTLSALEVE